MRLPKGVEFERQLAEVLQANPKLSKQFRLSSDEEDTRLAVDLWANDRPVQIKTFKKEESENLSENMKYTEMYTKARMRKARNASLAQIVFVENNGKQSVIDMLRFLFKHNTPGTFVLRGNTYEEVS